MNTNKIYTIGHSNLKKEEFLRNLIINNVNYIIDVRSIPYSKYVTWANRENLKEYLESNGIHYKFWGDVFGAKRKEPELYTNGAVDFNKVRNTENFKLYMDSIVKKAVYCYTICFMCTEQDPIDCHRSIMLQPALPLEMYHILRDGSIQTRHELEKRMLQGISWKGDMDVAYKYYEDKITNRRKK